MAWKPDYITLAEAKVFADSTVTSHDADTSVAITAASRAIDQFCNRQFGKVTSPEERLYTAEWDRRRCRWVVEIDDLMTTSGFVAEIQDEDGDTVAAIDEYLLEPRNAAAEGKPWTKLIVKPTSSGIPCGTQDQVAITASWGWSAVPVPVTEAARLQVNRFLKRRTSPHGIAGSPDFGTELRFLSKLDPDVGVALGGYVRWWAGA